MTLLPSSRPEAWGTQVRHWALNSPGELRELRASMRTALTPGADTAEMDDVPAKMVLVAARNTCGPGSR